MKFVNREPEIAALEDWWTQRGSSLGLVWGRRRVGKTALLQRFAEGRKTVFHTAGGRPILDELKVLSREAAGYVTGHRDLKNRPFIDWVDAFETLAESASRERILLVLDEFPELVEVAPELPATLRAVWDRVRTRTKLRVLVSGSAVRTMEAIQEARAPLYGRLDLRLLIHPFGPHEAALMLPALTPAHRALVWGLVGGVPLYLEWWNQSRSIRDNLLRLACTPGGALLTEGELALATEGDAGDLGRQALYAIAAGRTKHNEIADAIGADPTRVLERLVALRLVERIVPVTEDVGRTRRRMYRISDNFFGFWLGVLDRYRSEIERGLGRSILPVLLSEIDDHVGPRWEEAFRLHLRRLGEEGILGPEVVAVGRFWTAAQDPAEIDAVVLARRRREAVLVGEARWAREVVGQPIRRELERKAQALPRLGASLQYAVCARERVEGADDILSFTAADIFED